MSFERALFERNPDSGLEGATPRARWLSQHFRPWRDRLLERISRASGRCSEDERPSGAVLEVSAVKLGNGEVTEDLWEAARRDEQRVGDSRSPREPLVKVIDSYVVRTEHPVSLGEHLKAGSLTKPPHPKVLRKGGGTPPDDASTGQTFSGSTRR